MIEQKPLTPDELKQREAAEIVRKQEAPSGWLAIQRPTEPDKQSGNKSGGRV